MGIDLWSSKDQAGNHQEATLRNAKLEGIGERVEVHTADMRKLPFPDRSFEVITSSLAVHNIASARGREAALAEILRVLKPGGTALIADIGRTTVPCKAGSGGGENVGAAPLRETPAEPLHPVGAGEEDQRDGSRDGKQTAVQAHPSLPERPGHERATAHLKHSPRSARRPLLPARLISRPASQILVSRVDERYEVRRDHQHRGAIVLRADLRDHLHASQL